MDNKGNGVSRALVTRRQFLASTPAIASAGAGLMAGLEEVLRAGFLFGEPLSVSVPLSKIYLSGINWIDQRSPGIRLRWIFPLQIPSTDTYLGFPDAVRVQRATLAEVNRLLPSTTRIDLGMEARVEYPREWWKRGLIMRSIAPALFLPNGRLSVQAITFVYQGPDTRCRVRDSNHCVLGDFEIRNGQRMYFEGADISEVEFLSDEARKIKLSEDWFLDLYEPQNLTWQDVATIAVRTPLVDSTVGDFGHVQSRIGGKATLTAADWAAIQKHAMAADKVKKPGGDDPKLKFRTWDVWLAIQVLRWEIAVLSGYGFVHGPQPQGLVGVKGDSVTEWLPQPSTKAAAYRVVMPNPAHSSLGLSNVVVVPPGKAAALQPPRDLTYRELVVTPTQIVEDFDPARPSTSRSVYLGGGTLTWNHKQDPWAMGIDVSETILQSPSILKPSNPSPTYERISARSRLGIDLTGARSRNFELAFPDCPLKTSARTFDGWDRSSGSTPASQAVFVLRHQPDPPAFACAAYDSEKQTVRIDRLVDKPQCLDSSIAYPDWAPDDLVKTRTGTIEVARRQREPTTVAVKIVSVNAVTSDSYSVQLDAALPQGEFVNGRLLSNEQTSVITQVSADRKTIQVSASDASNHQLAGNNEIGDERCVPYGPAPASVIGYSAGPASVIEDPYAPALWTSVSSTAKIVPLDKQFVFPEPTPLPSDGTDSLVYACRVGFNDFNGRIVYGPYSNSVAALRKRPRPSPPPPFSVQALGWDYYRRLVVNVTLTADAVGGLFTIAWALGRKSEWLESGTKGDNLKSFASSGLVGLLGPQSTHQLRFLYEVLDVSEPQFADLYITVGVKGVDRIGQESGYRVEELLILAR